MHRPSKVGNILRVNATIPALDRVTQQNAALVEESAAAAASFREEAARLTENTAIFSPEESMPGCPPMRGPSGRH